MSRLVKQSSESESSFFLSLFNFLICGPHRCPAFFQHYPQSPCRLIASTHDQIPQAIQWFPYGLRIINSAARPLICLKGDLCRRGEKHWFFGFETPLVEKINSSRLLAFIIIEVPWELSCSTWEVIAVVEVSIFDKEARLKVMIDPRVLHKYPRDYAPHRPAAPLHFRLGCQ